MFKSDKINLWLSLPPLILSLILGLFIVLSGNLLPPKLPLFYSLPWGDNQLATRWQFLIIPSSIILITLFNLIVSWHLHPSQVFFKKILLFSSLLISTLFAITFFKIILIFF